MVRGTVAVIIVASVLAVTGPASGSGPAEAVLVNVAQIDAGDNHTCARLSTGQARCWGRNFDGQLGDDIGIESDVPITVQRADGGGPLTSVASVSAGEQHSCAVLTSGQARCWGRNVDGQLGDGTDDSSPRAVVVRNPAGTDPLTGVAQVVAGEDHTCARLTNGQVRCWGADDDGQLGNGGPTGGADRLLPRTVRGVGGTGVLQDVIQISAGQAHNCVTLESRQARCWGDNIEGELGDGTESDQTSPRVVRGVGGVGRLTDVARMAADSDQFSCAVLRAGQMRCFGDNFSGQLGKGDNVDSPLPVVVRNPTDTGPLGRVKQASGGTLTMCARLDSSQARCWGEGFAGQLGNGDQEDLTLPVVVRNENDSAALGNVTQITSGENHTCARLSTGEVRCWGDNNRGQLGDDDAPNDSLLPVAVVLG